MSDRDHPEGDDGAKRQDAEAGPTRAGATYADVDALPAHVTGEIVGGDLWVSPRPAFAHAEASSQVLVDLKLLFDRGNGGPGGWRIVHEPELHLGDDVLVPDLGGWRTARMPAIPSTASTDLAPDWVCEIVSPSTARLDRGVKLSRYHAHGVEWTWILDPLARTVEVFHHSGGGYVLEQTFSGQCMGRVRPFEAMDLDISRWWPA